MFSIMSRLLEISIEIEMERLGPWANFREKVILLLRYRPVTRGGARGAFAPSPQAPKVGILILNIQVKESSRLN